MKTGPRSKWYVWIALLFVTQAVFAQQVSVKGTVISGSDNFPVIGASIVEKGTTNGTITDMDGNFALSVNKGSIVQVSYIGFVTQDLPVAKDETLHITLIEDTQKLSEVVVTGYSSQKKADLTGAVAVV